MIFQDIDLVLFDFLKDKLNLVVLKILSHTPIQILDTGNLPTKISN